MPNDNIDRAIQRGTERWRGTLDEVTLRPTGPAASASWCKVVTSNRNRIVSEIRHMFSKNGGNLAENGRGRDGCSSARAISSLPRNKPMRTRC